VSLICLEKIFLLVYMFFIGVCIGAKLLFSLLYISISLCAVSRERRYPPNPVIPNRMRPFAAWCGDLPVRPCRQVVVAILVKCPSVSPMDWDSVQDQTPGLCFGPVDARSVSATDRWIDAREIRWTWQQRQRTSGGLRRKGNYQMLG
jgi:hypothetical protein